MPEYRWLFHDLLTNDPLIELPLYGTSLTRIINGVGDMRGSFALDVEGFSGDDIVRSTVPGRTALYVDRDNELIWGGVLWTRTYQGQSQTFQFSGQTFESWLYKEYIRFSQEYVDFDRRNVVRDVMNKFQRDPFKDLNIRVSFITEGTEKRSTDQVINAYEFHTVGEEIEEILGGEMDWTIDVEYIDDIPTKLLRIGNPRLGKSSSESTIVFDYPGNVLNYFFPENSANGVVTQYSIGKGQGENMLDASFTHEDLLDAGWPRLEGVTSYKSVSRQETLNRHVEEDAEIFRAPVTTPSFNVDPFLDPRFGSYPIGSYARFDIKDARFPEGASFNERILGWKLNPESSQNREEVSLQIEHESELV